MTHEKRTAVHAGRMAAHCGAVSGALKKCTGMAKAATKADTKLDPAELLVALQALVESFDGMQGELEDYQGACEKNSETNARKVADDRLNKRDDVQKPPAGFTTIIPTRAMPRAGQPAVPLAKSEPQLAAVAGLNEEDLHPIEAE